MIFDFFFNIFHCHANVGYFASKEISKLEEKERKEHRAGGCQFFLGFNSPCDTTAIINLDHACTLFNNLN